MVNVLGGRAAICLGLAAIVVSVVASDDKAMALSVRSDESEPTPKWTMGMWLEDVPLIWKGTVFTRKSLYLGELHVGTPRTKYTFIFDTGSGNTVLPQVSCKSLGCLNKQLYNASASPTSSAVVDDFSLTKFPTRKIYIRYGDGDLTGSFIRDRVCLDTMSEQCVMLNMVQADRMATNPFALFSFDGVLGLGLESLSASSNFSFVQQVMNQNPRMLRRLSIFLAAQGDANIITIGGYDESRAIGKPTWVEVTNPERGYWQVSVKSVTFGGTRSNYCDDGQCRAVTDLGSTLFNVPSAIIDSVRASLVKLVPLGVSPEGYDCLEFVKDSKAELDLGTFTITLPAKELLRATPFKRTYQNGTVRFVCPTKVHHVDFPPPLGPKVFILGHPLLRTYYTMYDWETKRIGFALANQSNTPMVRKERKGGTPVYIRSLNSTQYYLPHLTGVEPLMEEKLKEYGGSSIASNATATKDW